MNYPRRVAIRKFLSLAIQTLAVTLLVSACALAHEPARTIHGTWIAREGRAKVMYGTWSGGTLPHRPNVGEGSWTLSSGGEMVAAGAWRAEKSSRRWDGRWSGQTARGEKLGGTWGADLDHLKGKTFQDMLEQTIEQQVSGWWRSGEAQGNWWIKGPQSPPR